MYTPTCIIFFKKLDENTCYAWVFVFIIVGKTFVYGFLLIMMFIFCVCYYVIKKFISILYSYSFYDLIHQ